MQCFKGQYFNYRHRLSCQVLSYQKQINGDGKKMQKIMMMVVMLVVGVMLVNANPVLVTTLDQTPVNNNDDLSYVNKTGMFYRSNDDSNHSLCFNNKLVDGRKMGHWNIYGIGENVYYSVYSDNDDLIMCYTDGETITEFKKFSINDKLNRASCLRASVNSNSYYFIVNVSYYTGDGSGSTYSVIELWKYTVQPDPEPPSTKVNAKKISVKLDSSKPAKDSISISKAEFPTDQTFDPETNKVSVTIGNHEFTCDAGTWKPKNGVYKYKSNASPKVQLTIDTNKHTWDFKVAKTEVHKDIDVSKDIPIYLKIDDTLIGNDFAMTMKAKLDYKK